MGYGGDLAVGARAYDFDAKALWENVSICASNLRGVTNVIALTDAQYQLELLPLLLVMLGTIAAGREGLARMQHPTSAGLDALWKTVMRVFFPSATIMPGVSTQVTRLGAVEFAVAVGTLCSNVALGLSAAVKADAARAAGTGRGRGCFGTREVGVVEGSEGGEDLSELLHGAPPDMSAKPVGTRCSFRPPFGKLANYVRLACAPTGFPLGRGTPVTVRDDLHTRVLAARLRVPAHGVSNNEVFRVSLTRFAAEGASHSSAAVDAELLLGGVPKL
jgi:hypothetical protein